MLSPLRLAALAFALCLAPGAFAQEGSAPVGEEVVAEKPKQLSDETLDGLFERLANAEEREAARIENEITDRWAKSGSDSADLLLIRGRKALKKREFKKAIAHFSRLIALRPDFAEGWNARATAHFADRNLGRSVADLYEVLRLEPRHFGAMIGLGLIMEGLDRDEEAHAAYSAAQEIHPNVDGAKDGLERLRKSVEGEPI